MLPGGPLGDPVDLPPLWSGRGVCMVVSAGFDLPAAVRTPNRGFACGAHLVPRGAGTVYLGATNRLSTEPDLHRRPSLDEITTLIHDGATELNTGPRDAQLLTVRVGHRPVTTDHLPLVGRTHHDRVHVATGTYRAESSSPHGPPTWSRRRSSRPAADATTRTRPAARSRPRRCRNCWPTTHPAWPR